MRQKEQCKMKKFIISTTTKCHLKVWQPLRRRMQIEMLQFTTVMNVSENFYLARSLRRNIFKCSFWHGRRRKQANYPNQF